MKCDRPTCEHFRRAHRNRTGACRRCSCPSFVEPQPAPELKPLAEGICTRGGPASPDRGYSKAIPTLQVQWDDAEAVRGTYDFSKLRAMIDRSPTPIRLRPMLGTHAPEWAKQIGAGPGDWFEPMLKVGHTVGAVWDQEYQQAAEAFIAALAIEVDDDPKVRLVFASSAMMQYAEPLVRAFEYDPNIASLRRLGYTPEADAQICRAQLDYMEVFLHTAVGMAYNPWHVVESGTDNYTSAAKALELADHQLELFGPTTVLQNNELGRVDTADPNKQIYELYEGLEARKDQAVINFQCAAGPRIPDEYGAIKGAKTRFGATAVEQAGTLSEQQYAELDGVLKA